LILAPLRDIINTKIKQQFCKKEHFMTVEQINPHLRFAMSFKYPISDTPLVSYDTHIYYIKSGAGRISSGSTFESFENGSVIIVPTGTPYLFSSADSI
jgi:mannose-6-phosphate isomerase-like protein (cupin superfamily)